MTAGDVPTTVVAPRLVTFAPTGSGLRMATLLRASFAGLLLGNLGRIPVFSTGDRDVPVLLNDVLLLLLVACGLVRILQSRSLRLDRVALLAIAFATIGGVSAVLSTARFGLTPFELS